MPSGMSSCPKNLHSFILSGILSRLNLRLLLQDVWSKLRTATSWFVSLFALANTSSDIPVTSGTVLMTVSSLSWEMSQLTDRPKVIHSHLYFLHGMLNVSSCETHVVLHWGHLWSWCSTGSSLCPYWGVCEVYVPYPHHCPFTKNQVPSGVYVLELGFPWCPSHSEEYCCAWPCIGYWWVAIPSDDHYMEFWTPVPKSWSIDVQGHDVAPCSSVNFTVKFVDLWLGMCCPPQWPDVLVVLLFVEAVYLFCLHVVECHPLWSSLKRWAVLHCTWLSYQCPCCHLCLQLMDFCCLLVSAFL